MIASAVEIARGAGGTTIQFDSLQTATKSDAEMDGAMNDCERRGDCARRGEDSHSIRRHAGGDEERR